MTRHDPNCMPSLPNHNILTHWIEIELMCTIQDSHGVGSCVSIKWKRERTNLKMRFSFYFIKKSLVCHTIIHDDTWLVMIDGVACDR